MIGNAERGFIDLFPGLVKSCFFFIIIILKVLSWVMGVSFYMILCVRPELC